MGITWEILLHRRGVASLTQWAHTRGITTYDQLFGSFRVHGITPPTREEASNFLKDQDEKESSTPPRPDNPAPNFEDPIADVLYDVPEPSKSLRKSHPVKKKSGKRK